MPPARHAVRGRQDALLTPASSRPTRPSSRRSSARPASRPSTRRSSTRPATPAPTSTPRRMPRPCIPRWPTSTGPRRRRRSTRSRPAQKLIDFGKNPIGTGPFKFVKYNAGAERRDGALREYFGGTTKVDPQKIPAEGVRRRDPQLCGRDRGARQRRDPVAAEDRVRRATTRSRTIPNVQIAEYPDNGYYYLAFNLRAGPPLRGQGAARSVLDVHRPRQDGRGRHGRQRRARLRQHAAVLVGLQPGHPQVHL